jgi:hypothetical protein
MSGSRYSKPASGTRALDFSAGQVVLTGGNLSQAITNLVTLDSNNRVTSSGSNRLRVSITAANGSFRGSVTDAASSKPITFGGVLLQKRNTGYGFFLGTSQSGQVLFGPLP